MSGYTPVFSSIYDGTLYGRWPAAAVFATLLPLANARGEIDMSYEAIAGRTGWPLDLLEKGIAQLMEPDKRSRSEDDEGRRLVLMDTARPWGWLVVNHSLYREKARLAAKNARDVESGKEAHRKRHNRMTNKETCPPDSAAVRLSPPVSDPSNSNSNSNTVLKKATDVASRRGEAKTHWPSVRQAIRDRDSKMFAEGSLVYRVLGLMGGVRELSMRLPEQIGQTEQQFLNTYAELAAKEAANA